MSTTRTIRTLATNVCGGICRYHTNKEENFSNIGDDRNANPISEIM
jgi:hypothetical protein